MKEELLSMWENQVVSEILHLGQQ